MVQVRGESASLRRLAKQHAQRLKGTAYSSVLDDVILHDLSVSVGIPQPELNPSKLRSCVIFSTCALVES